MLSMPNWPRLKSIALVGTMLISGCGTRDEFPMHNPATGQDVVCHSGRYGFEEGLPQMRIAIQCIQACKQYGYRRTTGNPYADAPNPNAPDSDVRQEIPPQCQP